MSMITKSNRKWYYAVLSRLAQGEQPMDEAQALLLMGRAVPVIAEIVFHLLLARENGQCPLDEGKIGMHHGDTGQDQQMARPIIVGQGIEPVVDRLPVLRADHLGVVAVVAHVERQDHHRVIALQFDRAAMGE